MKNPQDNAIECDSHLGRVLTPVYEETQPAPPPKVLYYECAIDGKKYDENGVEIVEKPASEPVAAAEEEETDEETGKKRPRSKK